MKMVYRSCTESVCINDIHTYRNTTIGTEVEASSYNNGKATNKITIPKSYADVVRKGLNERISRVITINNLKSRASTWVFLTIDVTTVSVIFSYCVC